MEKIKDILKKYTFHPFLFLPYVIFYTVTKNYKDINLSMTYRPLLISVLFSVLLFFLVKLLLKDIYKTSIYVFIVLLFFSTYGVRYEFMEDLYYHGYWPFKHIHRFLLGSDLLILLLLFFKFKKYTKSLIGINAFLNTTLILLIVYNLAICAYNYSQIKEKKIVSNIYKHSNQKLPNIYYFILDGYANNITLKKHYKYNNKFLRFLKKEEFYVQDTAYSNYYGTNKSLTSTLNMDCYTKNDIYDNLVFKTLKENGYQINVLKSGYTVTANFKEAHVLYQPSGLNELERNLLEYTILRIDDIIGSAVYYRLKNQLQSIDHFITSKKSQFTFIHIVSPHPPYVFKRNGKKTFNINKSVNNWEPKEKYIDQLIYVSNVMKSKIRKIKKIDPNSIIILQSDHGPYITSNNKDEIFESRAYILNCIFAPKELQEKFSTTKSSVNTFIHVFNYLFDSKLVLKEDDFSGKKDLMHSITFKNKITH